MSSICGTDCNDCSCKSTCIGCPEAVGRQSGCRCIAYECYKAGGEKSFLQYKDQLLKEINALAISDLPQITELCLLKGSFVNLEYTLANGQKIKLLEDNSIYLGYQVEKKGSDRCYGLAADNNYLLVCEYGCNGSEPQIIAYQKRPVKI